MILENSSELDTLKKLLKPHTNRAYFVGGCVRDYYLKTKTKDIDIEIYDIDPEKFDILMKELDASGVGKSFFVYRYKNFDISLARVESKVAEGHRGFEVEVTNDTFLGSKRRDFTINSIMVNIFDEEVVDNHGGIKDLEAKVIRAIDPTTFVEDSLRVLRAVQFCARLGFEIDEATLNLCRTISLEDLSKSRVFLEFEKFFKGEFQEFGCEYIFQLNLYKKIFTIDFSKDDNERLKEYLKSSGNKSKFRYLYFLREATKRRVEGFLDSLEAPKEYYNFFKTQPEIDDIKTEKDLLELALKIPLGSWIGLTSSRYYDIAKKLDLLDKKFTPKIEAKTLLKEGFLGKELGEELARRELKEIEDYYERTVGTAD